jgi:hypothetical protein
LFEEHSHTSHPQEMQEVVKNGENFALIREGTQLIEGIITRPIYWSELDGQHRCGLQTQPKIETRSCAC